MLIVWYERALIQCAQDMRVESMGCSMEKSVKRVVNLRINKSLIDQAKSMHINLSQTLETSLVEILREKQKEAWLKDNRDAVDAYNEHIQKQGVFSDGLRQF